MSTKKITLALTQKRQKKKTNNGSPTRRSNLPSSFSEIVSLKASPKTSSILSKTNFYQQPRQQYMVRKQATEAQHYSKHDVIHFQNAHLSETYTNHCIRATSATLLYQSRSCEPRDICAVTGHKSQESLNHYVQGPTLEKRIRMSSILHNAYNSNSQISVPSATNNNSTIECNTNSTNVMIKGEQNSALSGPFSGANVQQCTINVKIEL